ncbi:hypothetical protein M2334_002465 [Sphingobium sp. B11D3D]|nr:hypothetical protein [Sphingobium sp. B11D3D]
MGSFLSIEQETLTQSAPGIPSIASISESKRRGEASTAAGRASSACGSRGALPLSPFGSATKCRYERGKAYCRLDQDSTPRATERETGWDGEVSFAI